MRHLNTVFQICLITSFTMIALSGCADDTRYQEGETHTEDDTSDGCPEGAQPGFPCADCSDPDGPILYPVTDPATCALVCPEGSQPWSCDAPPNICDPIPPPTCVQACGSDALIQPSCVDGAWACESGISVNDCPNDTCWGPPPSCCDGSQPMCDAGDWSCDVECPNDASISGTWTEQARLDCGDGSELQADDPIAEFIMTGDGAFELTFQSGLFETFVHYWGSYSYQDGVLRLFIDRGNYTPEPFDGEGTIDFLDNDLIRVSGMWLGQPDDEDAVQTCGYIFRRD